MKYRHISSGHYDYHEVTTIVNEAYVKAGLRWHFVYQCKLDALKMDYPTVIHEHQGIKFNLYVSQYPLVTLSIIIF
jgi:hypothetical protein